jgi:hypothetical protein
MGAIPLILEVDGKEIEVEANPNEKLLEVGARAVPPEKWDQSIVSTTSGLTVDPSKSVKEITRETGETRFKILARGDQGGIPEFPNFLIRVRISDSCWHERELEEIKRIKMLNNLITRNNPGFGYVNPRITDLDGHKVVNGWFKTIGFGSVEFHVFLPPAYPNVHPESTISGRFFDMYSKAYLHHHLYPYRIGGREVLAICGDKDYLYKWTGRLGVAHYIADVLVPWIKLESKALAKKMNQKSRTPESFPTNPIIDILRGFDSNSSGKLRRL